MVSRRELWHQTSKTTAEAVAAGGAQRKISSCWTGACPVKTDAWMVWSESRKRAKSDAPCMERRWSGCLWAIIRDPSIYLHRKHGVDRKAKACLSPLHFSVGVVVACGFYASPTNWHFHFLFVIHVKQDRMVRERNRWRFYLLCSQKSTKSAEKCDWIAKRWGYFLRSNLALDE